MEKRAVIVAGMAYGDEAKGATVDFLCRDLGASLVVRYNGGHQAAHNVCLEDGRHHTFSQFGSGTFIPGVRTHLSRFMLVNPAAMLLEEEHLSTVGVTDAFRRLTVDEQCVVVTPYHRAFNRLEEIYRGHRAHGSCGVGIGVARRLELAGLALRAHELYEPDDARSKLLKIKAYLHNELKKFSYELELTPDVQNELYWFQNSGWDLDQIQSKHKTWAGRVRLTDHLHIAEGPVIFEGAQGVLLDEKHGTAPHNTWTNTTFENAQTLLKEAEFDGQVTKLGCWRSYFTRHGAGPLRWEHANALDQLPEKHNITGRYQGHWRTADFDFSAAVRARDICGGIDEVAVSHLDYSTGFDLKQLEYQLQAPITILASGPTAKDRVRCPSQNPVSVAASSSTATTLAK